MADATDKLLLKALTDIQTKRTAARIKRLKKFTSIDSLLEHLADMAAKDREKFLKPWKTGAAAKGLGRPTKGDDIKFYYEFDDAKKAYEKKHGKKLSYRRFLDDRIKEIIAKLPKTKSGRHERVDELLSQEGTIRNTISRTRVWLKKAGMLSQ